MIAARVLALPAAAACPAGVAVAGAAGAAVAVEPFAGAVVAADVGAAALADAAAVELIGAAEETGAADETGAAVGVPFSAAGVTLVWCPAQPVASVTTSVTPATSVREDLRITSAHS